MESKGSRIDESVDQRHRLETIRQKSKNRLVEKIEIERRIEHGKREREGGSAKSTGERVKKVEK